MSIDPVENTAHTTTYCHNAHVALREQPNCESAAFTSTSMKRKIAEVISMGER